MSRPANAQTGDTQAALSFDADLLHGAFVQTPTALLRRPDVSANAKTLYALLLTYAIDKDVVWPGQPTLCKLLGVTDKPMRAALRELEALGLVTMQRGGDGQNARYHVRKMDTRAVSDTAKTPVLKPSRPGDIPSLKKQTRRYSGSRPGDIPVSIKEEVDKAELEAAATHTPAQEAQAAPVDASCAAAAGSPQKNATTVTLSKQAGKPSKPAPAPFPDPDVSLLDWERSDLDRLSRTDPAELVRRFEAQNPSFAEKIAKKRQSAHTSPNPLLARCIIEDWIPEARALRDAPKAAPAAPYKPPVNPPLPASYLARHAKLCGNSDTGRIVH